MTSRNAVIGRLFGLGAGVCYGIAAVLIRQGVSDMTVPLVGAAISMVFGSAGLYVVGGRGLKETLHESKKSLGLLLGSGLMASGGIIASFFALSLSPVTVVSPLQSTNPLFALLWSWMFLGGMEKISRRLILGCVLVVAGIVLITLGKP